MRLWVKHFYGPTKKRREKQELENQTKTGIIKTIVGNRGFGFITADEDKQDLFFHASGVINTRFEELREGLPVEFLIAEGKKGLKAIGVTLK